MYPDRTIRSCLLGLFVFLLTPIPTALAARNGLADLRWLQGHWQGRGEGPAGPSMGQRDIVCALDCRYLNMEAQHRPLEQNPEGTWYSTLAMWTWHPQRARLLLHSFDDFASVTTYEQQARSAADQLELLVHYPRDGSRARLLYRFEPPDAFVERYEHAAHGQPWQLQREYRFVRAKPALSAPEATPQSGSISAN